MKNFESFAKEIGFNIQVLDNYVTYADNYYNTFYVLKKNKTKKRQIDCPSKELKSIQRWLLSNYFNKIPISDRANGFVKGRGIKRNAKFHLDNSFILSIDIKDFFPSISQKQIFEALEKNLGENELNLKLAKLCTFKRHLPQGAPTSPALSNIVFKEIDDEITNYCKTKLVVYSRYADDLVFSCNTKNTLVEIYSFVNSLLRKSSFNINRTKTKYFSGKGRMVITGININEGRLSVKKEIKRNLRSNLYNVIVKNNLLINKNSVAGYLSFIRDIEPEYYVKLKDYIIRLKMKAKTNKIGL
jgi:RNA-directed DNA polymerase